jgi:hypothetical protein
MTVGRQPHLASADGVVRVANERVNSARSAVELGLRALGEELDGRVRCDVVLRAQARTLCLAAWTMHAALIAQLTSSA